MKSRAARILSPWITFHATVSHRRQRLVRRMCSATSALSLLSSLAGGAVATAAPIHSEFPGPTLVTAPTGETVDEFNVVHQTDPLVHIASIQTDGLHITECMAGYLFQRDGVFYGITTTACGSTGTVVSKLGQRGQTQRVGEIVAHDKADSFLAVIRFDKYVRQGHSYPNLPRGKHPRPFINRLDYFGRGAHSLDNPLVLSYPSDDADGVSTFAFSCEPRFAIPGSPLVINRNTTVGLYTSMLSTSLDTIGICFGVTTAYLEDFAQQGTWLQ
ncbi:hypothetical protein AL705_02955 [Lawsonella clevelandensis]|uniref:Peptidase S1 domain-containing protein n=1 Tax=Lawsonella clevelandensis TaxID=1528099 RepID=A0A0M3TBK7_9ACTN|nr:hypothetical protein [Lawsonella clevelandensis]ALE18794.1 hypothetical protein AL705_02955 [Lawsonella clevelandensis]